eukprot:TRINITY_DN12294_c0_g1_i1.p1 TRINITY_DN12294_c0_g1~~TRINITY_DN12294_c0_g1_i1.p1  ORF type:complete len:129 (+),score=6.22 TRINITY_DN12294_c0_g1_i1:423-809(+)
MAAQTGFLSGMPGCIEHTAKLDEAIRTAKEQRRPLSVAFFDQHVRLRHAQPAAVRAALVPRARAHAAACVQQLRAPNGVWGHGSLVEQLVPLGIGTDQGCTGSTGLITMAFNLILEPQCTRVPSSPAA